MPTRRPGKTADLANHADRVETSLQRLRNGAAQSPNLPHRGGRPIRLKHAAHPNPPKAGSVHSSTICCKAQTPARPPGKSPARGLSTLISFSFFLPQLTSKCQNADFSGLCGPLGPSCAQSYPQKLCVKLHICWAIISRQTFCGVTSCFLSYKPPDGRSGR